MVITSVTDLKVNIFADGADLAGMLQMYNEALDQRVHDQPNLDAQSRDIRLCGIRKAGTDCDPGSPDLV